MNKFNFKDYVSKNVLLKENESPFSIDGWNDDWFEEIGMMEALAEVAKIDYEIKNARRGSYATDGTLSGLADQLSQLARTFNDLSDQLMDAMNQFGDEEELYEGKESGLKAAIDAADNEYDENEYDSVDDYLETYTGGYKDEVEQHLKMKYEG